MQTGTENHIQTLSLHLFGRKGNGLDLFRSNSWTNCLCKYLLIYPDPYSLIGDVGTTQKTYRNIKKLLDFIGIKYSELGTKS
jgi:hypothetical protein